MLHTHLVCPDLDAHSHIKIAKIANLIMFQANPAAKKGVKKAQKVSDENDAANDSEEVSPRPKKGAKKIVSIFSK